MRSEWLLGSALLPALLILGCGDKGDDTGGGGGDGGAGDGGTAENCDGSGTLVLADEQNYVFDGQLDIQSAPTIGGGYDLDIGYTELALDLQGHALDPTSEAGARLSSAERSTLLALPSPAGLSTETRTA